ncbi:MAG: DegT/DnrJ/EryC1/StrS family aminotransferase, partial [Planctomycetota bacterium]
MNEHHQHGQDAPTDRPVPLLDLHRQNRPLRDAYLAELAQVLDSGIFVLGPYIERLEERIAAYSHSRYAVACASGSDALILALSACGVGVGDEVIVPSFTFFATAGAVARLGAVPVFADLDPITFNIAPDHVARLITKKTKAIIPVHLFGQSADMDALSVIADKHGIPLIEDAAQSIGAEWRGRRVGSLGDLGCFSFYPTKNLGAAGDAGIVTTNDPELAKRVRLLRVHGMEPRYYHSIVGMNSRLDAFQGAILNVKLDHLDEWTE